jgi:hypothetical protein
MAAHDASAKGKMVFRPGGGRPDRMAFKARGVAASEMSPDGESWSVGVVNDFGSVFEQALPVGALVPARTGTRWKYSAARGAGIHTLVVIQKTGKDGALVVSIRMKLEADLAAADPLRSGATESALASMVVTVGAGDDVLVASSTWGRARNGWRDRSTHMLPRYFGPAKRVFVSSECHPGSLGGLGGADATCQTLADAAGVGGEFRAWLADAYDGPSDRLSHATDPYVLLDGSVVARDWTDLVDGSIATAIRLDEHGVVVQNDSTCGTAVWTNVSSSGGPAMTDALEFACYEWTLALFSRWGVRGDVMATDEMWTDGGALSLRRCSLPARVYCFER